MDVETFIRGCKAKQVLFIDHAISEYELVVPFG